MEYTTYSRACLAHRCEEGCDLAECQCDCHEDEPDKDAVDSYDRSWGY